MLLFLSFMAFSASVAPKPDPHWVTEVTGSDFPTGGGGMDEAAVDNSDFVGDMYPAPTSAQLDAINKLDSGLYRASIDQFFKNPAAAFLVQLPIITAATSGTTKTSVKQIMPFPVDVHWVAGGVESSAGSAATMQFYSAASDGSSAVAMLTTVLDVHTTAGRQVASAPDTTKGRVASGGLLYCTVTATGGTVTGALGCALVRRAAPDKTY